MKSAVVIVAGVGVLLVLLVLVGPALVDWSRYKGDIAQRLERATGRDVAIDGPVGLRLLPSPTFSAERLSIGNMAGAGDKPMATVERVHIRLKLLPLLTGKVEVTALVLDKPVIDLVRLADGRANWQFGEPPPAKAEPGPGRPTLKGEPPPASEPTKDVSLGNAAITDGIVTYRNSDAKPLRLEAIDAQVTAGSPSGPFSAEGNARAEGVPLRFDAAIDRIAAGRGAPVNVALTLPDSDARLSFAGILSELSTGQTLNGRLTLAAADPRRLLPALPSGTLAAEATLTVNGEEATAADLVLTLGELRATGNLGAAFGDVPQIDANLHLAALDLDKWLKRPAEHKPAVAPSPAQPATTLRPAQPEGAPSPAAEPRFTLPDTLFADVKLAADTIGWRGQVVRQAHVKATLAQGELVLRQANAQLPGGSTLSAEGILVAAKGKPVFDGALKLDSDNPRALLAWLGVDSDTVPAGRLTVASPVHVAWPELALPDFRLSLGNDSTKGRLKARIAEPLDLDLAATTRKFGEITAVAAMQDNAVDARITALGGNASVRGSLGDAPRLTVSARHPDAVQVLRHFTESRPRGPLGALALDARLAGQGKAWDVSELRLAIGELRLTGQARADLTGAKPLVTAELAGNDWALDPFLAAERTGLLLPGGPRLPPTMAPAPLAAVPAATGAATGAATKVSAAPWSRESLNLGALNAFDARIGLKAGSLAAKGWKLDGANARLSLQDGTAAIEQLTGKLLGGDLTLVGKLAAGAVPALSAQLTVLGADVGAVKPGAGGIAVTQGRLDAEARFAAAGRSSFDLISRLDGNGRILVRDGTIAGFDLPAVSQRMKNIENVGSLLGLVQAGLNGGITPFSSLAGTFHAKDGVVVTRDLKLDAQGGGATAESTIDLPRWTTATTIAFRLADQAAPPLLLRLEGPIGNPRKVIDINALQQYLAARGLGRALKGKDGGLVESLLGGKPPPAREGQPAEGGQTPSPEQPAEKPSRVLRDLLKGLGGR